jgi:ABC-type amino acid transport substrate-binding protein
MPKKVLRSVRVLVPALALAAALLPARAVAASPIKTQNPGILRVCLYAGFAPFAYKEGGVWKGWDVDYLTAFATASSLAFEVVEEPDFKDIWLRPGEGKCDIAGTGISDTEERRKATKPGGAWSATYYHVLRSFLVRTPDYAKLANVRGLRGRTAIVTQGSTAHIDLCYRMQEFKMVPCQKPDDPQPCANLTAKPRKEHPSCVLIEYPRDKNEANAAIDVAAGKDEDQDSPFAYGGGFGSVQTLVCQTPGLTVVWPHCNRVGYDRKTKTYLDYAEPFSFVVASGETDLLAALNRYIADQKKHPYAGTPIPDLGCKTPPWTQ